MFGSVKHRSFCLDVLSHEAAEVSRSPVTILKKKGKEMTKLAAENSVCVVLQCSTAQLDSLMWSPRAATQYPGG